MNKTAKGALAATTAAVLLMGGAGTLAYWTDADTVNGGTFTSGNLDITATGCDAGWVYAPGSASAGKAVTKFVPGDKITRTCSFSITGEGDNLKATVAAPTSLAVTGSKASSLKVDTATTYVLSKGTTSRALANGGEVTSADSGSTLTATFVSTVDFGTNEAGTPKVNANDMQNVTATVNSLTVSLTQVDPNKAA
jgi:alternate signal-mediated exported protein